MPITFKRSSKLTSIPVAYQYYKWHITGKRSNLFDPNLQVSEFRFQFNEVDTDASVVSISLLDGHTSPSGEEISKLIDGTVFTKFLDFDFLSGGTQILFEFATPQAFNGYRWATANDDPDRDPKSWTLYGSNDNYYWDVIDTIDEFDTTTDRYTFITFSYENGTNFNNIESKVTFTSNPSVG